MSEKNQQLSLQKIVEKYNKKISEAMHYNYLVRDHDLQTNQYEDLEKCKKEIKELKYQSINQRDEQRANMFFFLQCLINSVVSILKMWIALKKNDYVEAWTKLIDAQEYVAVSLRANVQDFGVGRYVESLSQIEKVIFPGWPRYFSPSIVETNGKCSICKNDYGSCDHIEGLVYMGQLCQRIDRQPIEVKEVSMVSIPRDKRCIIRYISTDEGKKRDYITWKVLDEKFPEDKKDKYLLVEGVVMNISKLDFD